MPQSSARFYQYINRSNPKKYITHPGSKKRRQGTVVPQALPDFDNSKIKEADEQTYAEADCSTASCFS
jgi:hypothetical protein